MSREEMRRPEWLGWLRAAYAVLLASGVWPPFFSVYQPVKDDSGSIVYPPLVDVEGQFGGLAYPAMAILFGLMIAGIVVPRRVAGWYAGLAAVLALMAVILILTRADTRTDFPALSPTGSLLVVVLIGTCAAAACHVVAVSPPPARPGAGSSRPLHLTERRLWEEAVAEGGYRWSTRGKRLEDEGFIHACLERQLAEVAELQYGDLRGADLVVLVVDPARLDAVVRYESPAPHADRYPHIYGPIPVDAVAGVRAWRWPRAD